MNQKKYRRLLFIVFVVYLCAILCYLCSTKRMPMAVNSLAVDSATKEEKESSEIKLMPLGMPVGIYVRAKGVMVLGTGEVKNEQGDLVEPAKDLLKSGDYLLKLNGENIDSIDWLTETMDSWKGGDMDFTLLRDDEEMQVSVTPVRTETAGYKIGVWIRQDAHGIGTLSYVDENNHFAALGHGITDVDTSEIIDISGGRIYESCILSIVKGEKGVPGEMVGNIDYAHGEILGRIEINNEKGIYGIVSNNQYFYDEEKALPVASASEVKKGAAFIRCCVDQEIKDYEIEIESLDVGGFSENRDLVLKITDRELLGQTNGIIQGMSGSPILQDGKIIGAVTHVLVNDPTMGYGIFIENMLDAAA